MSHRLLTLWLGAALALGGGAGCHCCHHNLPPPPPCGGCPASVGAFPAPAPTFPPAPLGQAPGLPPAPAPVVGPRYEPPVAQPPEVQQGSYYWQPADGTNNVTLSPPVPYGKEPPRVRDSQDGRELPRVRDSQDGTPQPMPRAPEGPPKVQGGRDNASAFPVGIAQFAIAQDSVANGLRPSIEGLDWLRDNGYRTVLHVRLPGEDDSADQKQVAKRGMKFLSLEVSPQKLTPRVVDDFARMVEDPRNAKLFVYDKDGMLAGGLWYLYFRTIKMDPEETARIKAARLGLGEDKEGDHREMWVAIQKYLSDRQK